MGVAVVYLYKNKIEKELTEKYQNQQNNKKLLLFYAPWCGASKAFLPWERLTSELKTETYNVDLEENKEISNQFNIQYLPTVFLMNGNNKLKYDGDRSYEDIMSFVNNN